MSTPYRYTCPPPPSIIIYASNSKLIIAFDKGFTISPSTYASNADKRADPSPMLSTYYTPAPLSSTSCPPTTFPPRRTGPLRDSSALAYPDILPCTPDPVPSGIAYCSACISESAASTRRVSSLLSLVWGGYVVPVSPSAFTVSNSSSRLESNPSSAFIISLGKKLRLWPVRPLESAGKLIELMTPILSDSCVMGLSTTWGADGGGALLSTCTSAGA